jgi:hypothetical protein
VILEAMFHRKPGHPDVHARLARVAPRIEPQHRAMVQHRRIEQHDIDAVMKIVSLSHRQKFFLSDNQCPIA